jgi:hypothetical protein
MLVCVCGAAEDTIQKVHTTDEFLDIIEIPALAAGARRDSNKPADISFLIVQMVAEGATAMPLAVIRSHFYHDA